MERKIHKKKIRRTLGMFIEKKHWDGKCQFFGRGVNVEEDHQRLQRSVYDVREMEYKAEDAQWTRW